MAIPMEDLVALNALGANDAPLLGEGGEARVYELTDRMVLRLLRPGASIDLEMARAELLAEIADASSVVSFATPQVDRVVEVEGRVAVIERRLPGIPLDRALASVRGEERRGYVLAYLNAANQIGDIGIKRDFFGDIGSARPVRRSNYPQYLQDRLAATQSEAGPLRDLVLQDTTQMPSCSEKALVHFDVFPANVLVDAGRITAIIDFGATAMMADRRLDAWSAVAYLDPELSPNAQAEDRALARKWLDLNGLGADFETAKRWIASYWCFAHDDPNVRAWCSRVLSPV